MKKARILWIMLCLACLLDCSKAIAKEQKDSYSIPILEAWDASNSDELVHNIWTYYWEKNVGDGNPIYNESVNIRFGGTTEQLIVDKENWDLAIVSSADVDLQKLADKDLLMSNGYVPSNFVATTQWLYFEQLQSRLPIHPILMYDVYFYDYNTQTGDATLMICQANIGRKKNSPRSPNTYAQLILEKRSANQVRTVEGIVRASFVNWTPETLLTYPDEWDVATLSINSYDELDALDQADLLYDFSKDPYWLSRNKDWPAPSGAFSTDGRMIAIPFAPLADIYPNAIQVMVMNAKGVDIDKALAYEQHWMKSYEWMYDKKIHNDTPEELKKKYGICIYKDQVDW